MAGSSWPVAEDGDRQLSAKSGLLGFNQVYRCQVSRVEPIAPAANRPDGAGHGLAQQGQPQHYGSASHGEHGQGLRHYSPLHQPAVAAIC